MFINYSVPALNGLSSDIISHIADVLDEVCIIYIHFK